MWGAKPRFEMTRRLRVEEKGVFLRTRREKVNGRIPSRLTRTGKEIENDSRKKGGGKERAELRWSRVSHPYGGVGPSGKRWPQEGANACQLYSEGGIVTSRERFDTTSEDRERKKSRSCKPDAGSSLLRILLLVWLVLTLLRKGHVQEKRRSLKEGFGAVRPSR